MRELFVQTRDLIHVLTETIYYFRCQNFTKGYRLSGRITGIFQSYIEALAESGMTQVVECFLPVFQTALEAFELQDGMRLADLFEAGMLPDLMHLQQEVFGAGDDILCDYWGKNRRILKERYPELYRKILERRDDISDAYQINWAETGDLVLTVENERGTIRSNSLVNPWREAVLYAANAASHSVTRYVVAGFGMGYHVEQLLRQSPGKKVLVLENDLNQLAIAFSYRDLSALIQNPDFCIELVSDIQTYIRYMSDIGDKGKICIWDFSAKSTGKKELREFLENEQVELASWENQENFLLNNFQKNICHEDENVSGLQPQFGGKTMILVAGGPSLDSSLESLKERKEKDVILVCVGKVARKLLDVGIDPDYIVMTDAQEKTRWQTKGIESCGIPLIYLSTAASSVVAQYQGPRYIAYQSGFSLAEEQAKKEGAALFQTGGSVTTFALDLGIQLGCRQIVCVGTDMSYIDGRTHTKGVGSGVASNQGLRQVEGISAQYVYTSKTLDIYRRWIEWRIKQEKRVLFINTSQGARIHGMKEKSLEKVFEELPDR